jgi:hypothetical protein
MKIGQSVCLYQRPMKKSEAKLMVQEMLQYVVTESQIRILETSVDPTQSEHAIVAEVPADDGSLQKMYFIFSFKDEKIHRLRIMNEIHI